MTFRIYFELADGSEDSVVVTGETIEEIRDKANKECAKRKPVDAWSEEVRP